jgi:hypothetical protein
MINKKPFHSQFIKKKIEHKYIINYSNFKLLKSITDKKKLEVLNHYAIFKLLKQFFQT